MDSLVSSSEAQDGSVAQQPMDGSFDRSAEGEEAAEKSGHYREGAAFVGKYHSGPL